MEQITYVLVYLIWLTLTTMWLTFVCIQNVLGRDKPFIYNPNNRLIRLLQRIKQWTMPMVAQKTSATRHVVRRTIDDRLKEFVGDVVTNYVTKWYVCISNDRQFPIEVQSLLDATVRRLLQVLPDVDSKQCLYGLLIIYLKHLKEYRRALKRSVKIHKPVEDIYRYTYDQDVREKLTSTLLHQFINWELWNSLPCQTLNLILAKQLTGNLLHLLSAPSFINYKLIEYCASTETQTKLHFAEYCSMVAQAQQKIEDNDEKAELLMVERDGESQTPKKPKLQMAPVAARVKIHEPKTVSDAIWRNSTDLDSIALGQDILAIEDHQGAQQINELIFKKLWKDSEDTLSEEKVWDSPEDDDLNLSPTTTNLQNAANLITNTIGHATVNTMTTMKEFQNTTVNSVVKPVSQATSTAMHKIGDLQDEAAEMMEGFLDYGMSRLRKGLCLTGLQGNISELTQKAKHEFHRQDAKNDADDVRKTTHDVIEHIPNDVIQHNPHDVIVDAKIDDEMADADENSVWFNPMSGLGPPLITETVTDSPDLEYEETPDLTTAIAKLRTLLQQKSSESGVTTPSLSPMPQEEVMKSVMSTPLESIDLLRTDGPVPILYKLCARTATGVFHNTLNTIKTALPAGNASGPAQHDYDVELLEADPTTDDFQSRMKKLLSERSAFCTVDAAYEAIQSMDVRDHPRFHPHWDDETDEDLCAPITHALLDIICELTNDVNTCITRETIVKSFTILFGNDSEAFLVEAAECFVQKLKNHIRKLPTTNTNGRVVDFSVDEMVAACGDAIPNYVRVLVDRDVVEGALRLFVASLQHHRINEDVLTQMFELLVAKVAAACGRVSPAYSA